MAVLPTWIDISGGAYAQETSGQIGRAAKDGDTLYAILPNNTDRLLYTSTDLGVTWTNTTKRAGNAALGPSNGAAETIVHQGYIHHWVFDNSSDDVWYTYKNLASGNFSNWSNLYHAGNINVATGKMAACGRPDGSFILVTSNVSSGGRENVIIKKLSAVAGSWSTISELYSGSSTTSAALQSGVVDPSTGDFYFFTEEYTGTAGTPPTKLQCYKVAASDDSVNGPYTVNADVENGYFTVNIGPPAFSSGNLAISYAYHFQDATNTYAIHKVSFGSTSDLSTWTTTTVNATADIIYEWTSGDGQTVFTACAYAGTTPWVYYATPYPASRPGGSYPNWSIWRSSYSGGTWAAPEKYYDPGDTDPTLDPLRATHNGLNTIAAFQLVPGSGGPGILLDVENWYAGYIVAPAGRANNYSSSGGPMATHGKYSSA